MDYKLRTKKNKDITYVTDTYYDFKLHIYKHFGHDSICKIIDKTQVKYENIWYQNEHKTLFIMFSQLLSDEFHNIFTKGLFNIHDEVFKYFIDANNFYSYADWYNTFYDILSDAENNICVLNMVPRTTQFIQIIHQFDALHKIKLNQHYKNKKKFVKSAIVMAKVKHIRALHLFINRNYYKLFSFKLIPILKTIYNNRFKHMDDINTFIIPSGDFDKNRCDYLLLALKTFKKGPFGHCHFIGSVLNRLFCKDIALYICDFI